MTERTKHRICALLVAACFLLAAHMEYQDQFGGLQSGNDEERAR